MFSNDLFSKGDVVAVGVSGGRDSICLLHMLAKSAKETGITVKAINVEHGIRGKESVADSKFVRKFCRLLKVPFKGYSVDVPEYCRENGLGEEEGARRLRYECFRNAIDTGFCDKVATAHHAGDNAETVLMNLFRGSSLSGVSGIKPSTDDGRFVRPMLHMTRQEIDGYIELHNLPYVSDSTNEDDGYTRNYIRNRVLPLVSARFAKAEAAINRFAELARAEDELLDELSDSLITENSVLFTDLKHRPLFYRACLKVMKRMGICKDFERVHLSSIYNLTDSCTGAYVTLKNGVVAYKNYDRVSFEKERPEKSGTMLSEVKFEPGDTVFGDYVISAEKVVFNEKNGLFFRFGVNSGADGDNKPLYFDFDKLPEEAVFRTRRPGDEIVSFGGGKKSLKKYLTEKKISARVSEGLPLLACGNLVYWVAGADISALLKVDIGTETIIKISCKKKGANYN